MNKGWMTVFGESNLVLRERVCFGMDTDG
jgi:hypothetical protein